jgi:hypothetical protein
MRCIQPLLPPGGVIFDDLVSTSRPSCGSVTVQIHTSFLINNPHGLMFDESQLQPGRVDSQCRKVIHHHRTRPVL